MAKKKPVRKASSVIILSLTILRGPETSLIRFQVGFGLRMRMDSCRRHDGGKQRQYIEDE